MFKVLNNVVDFNRLWCIVHSFLQKIISFYNGKGGDLKISKAAL